MKRIILLTFIITGFISVISAQDNTRSQNPVMLLNPVAGYITINELTYGIGIGLTTGAPYSNHFLGFTTLHGYQLNKSFLVAGGTGVYFYNGGTLIPLFLDLRYRVYISRFTPYVFGDGGFLLDFSGKKDTRAFVNPGIGCSYTINPKLAVNLGTGLFVQWGNVRDSYINIKAGVVYKF